MKFVHVVREKVQSSDSSSFTSRLLQDKMSLRLIVSLEIQLKIRRCHGILILMMRTRVYTAHGSSALTTKSKQSKIVLLLLSDTPVMDKIPIL